METLIKNHNGKIYLVVATKGLYSIVKDVKNKEYIVTFNLKKYEDGLYSWGSGSYFNDIKEAMQWFNNKVEE